MTICVSQTLLPWSFSLQIFVRPLLPLHQQWHFDLQQASCGCGHLSVYRRENSDDRRAERSHSYTRFASAFLPCHLSMNTGFSSTCFALTMPNLQSLCRHVLLELQQKLRVNWESTEFRVSKQTITHAFQHGCILLLLWLFFMYRALRGSVAGENGSTIEDENEDNRRDQILRCCTGANAWDNGLSRTR